MPDAGPHGGCWRLLHIDCGGSGFPIIVFDSGALDSSRQWNQVQPEIAKVTRACSFDRAGLGWSERSPSPPTFKQNVQDLHELLRRAHEPGPYVLVGHSNGGLDVRAFAHAYASEVAGMVLDDSVDAGESLRFPQRFTVPEWARLLLRVSMPFGIPRLFGWCDHSAACPDCGKFTDTLLRQLSRYQANEAEVNSSASFGNMPLFVLAHDPAIGLSGDRDKAFERAWSEWQKAFAARSSRSKLEIASHTGHEIQNDEPQVVIEAVEWVVAEVRADRQTRLPSRKK